MLASGELELKEGCGAHVNERDFIMRSERAQCSSVQKMYTYLHDTGLQAASVVIIDGQVGLNRQCDGRPIRGNGKPALGVVKRSNIGPLSDLAIGVGNTKVQVAHKAWCEVKIHDTHFGCLGGPESDGLSKHTCH